MRKSWLAGTMLAFGMIFPLSAETFSPLSSLENTAKSGDQKAILALAQAYLEGQNVPVDPGKAESWLMRLPSSAPADVKDQAQALLARVRALTAVPVVEVHRPAVPKPTAGEISRVLSDAKIAPVDVVVRQGENPYELKAFRDRLLQRYPVLDGSGVDIRPLAPKQGKPYFEMVLTGVRNEAVARLICGFLELHQCQISPRNGEALSVSQAPPLRGSLGGVANVADAGSITVTSPKVFPLPGRMAPLGVNDVAFADTEFRIRDVSSREDAAKRLAEAEADARRSAEAAAAIARSDKEKAEAVAAKRAQDLEIANKALQDAQTDAQNARAKALEAENRARREHRARQNLQALQDEATRSINEAKQREQAAAVVAQAALKSMEEANILVEQTREQEKVRMGDLRSTKERLTEFERLISVAQSERAALESKLRITQASETAARADAEQKGRVAEVIALRAQLENTQAIKAREVLLQKIETVEKAADQARKEADMSRSELSSLRQETERTQEQLARMQEQAATTQRVLEDKLDVAARAINTEFTAREQAEAEVVRLAKAQQEAEQLSQSVKQEREASIAEITKLRENVAQAVDRAHQEELARRLAEKEAQKQADVAREAANKMIAAQELRIKEERASLEANKRTDAALQQALQGASSEVRDSIEIARKQVQEKIVTSEKRLQDAEKDLEKIRRELETRIRAVYQEGISSLALEGELENVLLAQASTGNDKNGDDAWHSPKTATRPQTAVLPLPALPPVSSTRPNAPGLPGSVAKQEEKREPEPRETKNPFQKEGGSSKGPFSHLDDTSSGFIERTVRWFTRDTPPRSVSSVVLPTVSMVERIEPQKILQIEAPSCSMATMFSMLDTYFPLPRMTRMNAPFSLAGQDREPDPHPVIAFEMPLSPPVPSSTRSDKPSMLGDAFAPSIPLKVGSNKPIVTNGVKSSREPRVITSRQPTARRMVTSSSPEVEQDITIRPLRNPSQEVSSTVLASPKTDTDAAGFSPEASLQYRLNPVEMRLPPGFNTVPETPRPQPAAAVRSMQILPSSSAPGFSSSPP